MQNNALRTEGIVALEMLQQGKYRIWARKEIESGRWKYRLSKTQTDVLLFIAKENSMQIIPSGKSIREEFNLGDSYSGFSGLKRRGMAFDATILEIVGFFGRDYLGFHGSHIELPKHLEWFYPYLSKYKSVKKRKGRGSVLSWKKKIEVARSYTYDRHWIALMEGEDGLPCYYPLGLHLPRS